MPSQRLRPVEREVNHARGRDGFIDGYSGVRSRCKDGDYRREYVLGQMAARRELRELTGRRG